MTAYPTPRTDRETDALFTRWARDHDAGAREQLILRWMPLARRMAARYRSGNEPFDDLLQVASVGLIGAIDRFDPSRGIAFTSFAVPTIIGEIKRHFRNTAWAAHVPRRAQELSLRVQNAARTLSAHSGHAPGVAELARYLELDLEEVIEGLEAGGAHHATSLHAPATVGDDGEDSVVLADTLGAEDDRFALTDTRVALSEAMRGLPVRERQALSLRLRGDLRQVEIAEQLGCSQMQVSRLLRRAADRLREVGAVG
jgi:RNA polymerase sigma-B factor